VNVVFVEPALPPTQRHFVRALADVGAHVIGIGERPAEWLDDEPRSWLARDHVVPNVVDVAVLTAAVRWTQEHAVGGPARGDDRGAYPARRPGAGELHDPRHLGANRLACRGKPAMKEAPRSAGIPAAASAVSAPRRSGSSRARSVTR
jgi:hypothetical protein